MAGAQLSLVAQTARQYIRAFQQTPIPRAPTRRFFRTDPDAGRLLENCVAHPRLTGALYRHMQDSQLQGEILRAGVEASNNYEGGLSLGFLDPDILCTVGSEEFRKGFTMGQVLYLKLRPVSEKRWKRFGTLMTGVSLLYLHATHLPVYDARYRDLIEFLTGSSAKIASALSLGSLMAYGTTTMLVTRLLGNDAEPSHRLIIRGPFRYHRNPFYASVGMGTTLGAAYLALMNLLTVSPNYPVCGALGLGMAVLFRGYHLGTLRDERALEKQFGSEYRTYQAATPRYLPSLRALCSDAWGWLAGHWRTAGSRKEHD
ncbi:MAG: hypothetical protein HYV02_01000 [Deltaproteobacteria bacterium]|nr:hypothetical protein [Deltaproteobacteria bacterium]